MNIRRREFLRGTAGVALALPVLDSLHAQAAGSARRRFLVFATVLGTFPEHFWPRPTGSAPWPAGYQPQKRYFTGTTPADITNFQLEPIGKPLEPFKKDLLYVEGLDPNNCNGHAGYCNLMTAATPGPETGGGITFDQALAKHIGGGTPFASVQLGIGCGGSTKYATLSFYDRAKGAPAESNPRVVWDRLFANVSGGAGAAPDPAIERVRRQNKSVLDGAIGQVEGLKRRLGGADQAKLDGYLTSLREVEARLANVAAPASASCARPPAITAKETQSSEVPTSYLPEVAKLQVENLAMAFACDLTRVATLQSGSEGTNNTYPWLGINRRHHDLSHTDHDNPAAPADYLDIAKIGIWNAGTLAALLTRLKSIPEGEGTVYDNTTVLWVHGLTYGATHSNKTNPILLIGNSGGYFRTGRHVRLLGGPVQHSLANLFVQLGRSFGMPLNSFGEAQFNTGSLDILKA